jgi:putative endonuclease
MVFYYVYVLESLKDGNHYTGYTRNLKQRIKDHAQGNCFSTKFRLPLKLIYFEGCLDEEDAKRRESYLKTTQGRRFLGLQLIKYKRNKTTFGIGS